MICSACRRRRHARCRGRGHCSPLGGSATSRGMSPKSNVSWKRAWPSHVSSTMPGVSRGRRRFLAQRWLRTRMTPSAQWQCCRKRWRSRARWEIPGASAFALYNFGVLAMRAGRLDEAQGFLEECRVVSAASGNTFGVACSVFRLGWVAGARGDHGQALESLRESLRLNWQLRNRRVVALCLEQLACLGGSSGGPGDQARLFGAAETLFEQLPDYTLPRQMLEAHERGAAGARNVLGEPAFSDAWMAGRAMTIDQAVSLGLGLSASRGEAG